MLPLILSLALTTPSLAASDSGKSSPAKRSSGLIRSGVTQVAGLPDHRKSKRQAGVDISNEKNGTSYVINIEVGTPGQTVTVIVDTGSPDLWVNPSCETSGQADYCSTFSQFDYTQSSSLQDTGAADLLSYGKGNVSVEYVTDVVKLGSATISEQVFGIGFESYDIPLGILGLSPPVGDSKYPYVLDSMATQELISIRAFSLDLRSVDEPEGSIIFGGLDTGKFIGELEKLPMLDPSQTKSGADRYWVVMNGVGITTPDGVSDFSDYFEVPVFLDSGGTLSRLPTPIYEAFGLVFPGAQYDEASGFFDVDCAIGKEDGSVEFVFGNKVISVAYKDFIWENDDNKCVLGVLPNDDEAVLGDSFLRAAYVIYDQDNRNLHLAQAANCGSNLMAFDSGSDGVPSVKGDCTMTAVAATATSNFVVTNSPTKVATTGAFTRGDGPGPALTKVSVAGGLSTHTVCTSCGKASATPTGKKNDAGSGVGLDVGSLAVGVMVNVGAWLL